MFRRFAIYIHCLINYLFNRWMMNLPVRSVRIFFIKARVAKVGKNFSSLMKLELRNPGNIFIGDHVILNRSVLLDGRGGTINIGNNVDIGQETNIWTLEHDVHDDYHKAAGAPVVIEDFVWVANRVTILPGVTIGRGAVIACNSVVTKDVPPMAIMGGIPARKIGDRKSQLLYTLSQRAWFE